MFVTTLIVDDKYSDKDFDYFATLNSNKLISKRKIFSKFLILSEERTSNFKQFENKDNRHSQCMSEITGCAKLA